MADTQTISLSDIPVRLALGVPEAERARLQDVFVSLSLTVEAPPSPTRDDLASTVDYDTIIRFLREDLPIEGPIQLIETVADRIAAFVLSLSARIDAVDVTVKKPSVLAAPAMVSVSLTRHADPARRRQGLSIAEGGR
jgi:FolB domain-containing protein